MILMSRMEFYSRIIGLLSHPHGKKIFSKNYIWVTVGLKKAKEMQEWQYFGQAWLKILMRSFLAMKNAWNIRANNPRNPCKLAMSLYYPGRQLLEIFQNPKIKIILWSLIIIQSTLRHSNSRVKQVKMLFRVLWNLFEAWIPPNTRGWQHALQLQRNP